MAKVLELFKNEEIIDFSQGIGSLNKEMMGDRLFPDMKTQNLQATYFQLSDGLQIPTMAQVHAFDAEAKIGSRPTMEKITVENLDLTGYTVPTPHASLLVIRAPKGLLGCGYINAAVADKLNDAAAIVSGVKNYDDMLKATVHTVSAAAAELGITVGMTGLDALKKMQ